MPIKPLVIQKRMAEIGRIRLGEKGPKGEPRKLTTFRFTSASRDLLESIAAKYGGSVREWKDAPDEGYYEITTAASEIGVVFPPIYADADGTPTVPLSQWLELWSGGGCQRRCDGETEILSEQPCMCNPEERACKPTTRISVLLPDIRGLGLWRLESKGWNAAAETPGAVSVLTRAATAGDFIAAVIRIEQRTKKVPGEGTRRYIVPVIDIPGASLNEIAAGKAPLSINGPTVAPPRPELPRAVEQPNAEPFEIEDGPEFGEQPPLPGTITGLTSEAFAKKVKEAGISETVVKKAGKEIFPGKTMKSLTNAERGQLWQIVRPQVEEPQGAPV